jgi:hypothetical protein
MCRCGTVLNGSYKLRHFAAIAGAALPTILAAFSHYGECQAMNPGTVGETDRPLSAENADWNQVEEEMAASVSDQDDPEDFLSPTWD